MQMEVRVKRTREAARYVGLSESTLEKMRTSGRGPKFVRLGGRAVGYLVEDLDAFLDAGRGVSALLPVSFE
jgi:predicted DNA-binding transcriptional regulator AlpA